jgi:hypothetical protein
MDTDEVLNSINPDPAEHALLACDRSCFGGQFGEDIEPGYLSCECI